MDNQMFLCLCMEPIGMIQYGTMKRQLENSNPFRYGCVVEDSF